MTFHFPHLNLDRLTKVMDKYLKTAREDWDSDLDFTFGANEGGAVKSIRRIRARLHLLQAHQEREHG